MVIRHNMMAMNASRQTGIVQDAFHDKTEKLSSGYRINRGADDAAGLAISEKMRRQIRGLTQASANAQDGISYVQTAEGALHEVHDLLQRGNELCVKAANGTNSQVELEAIQAELDQIHSEVNRIATHTEFNEKKVFDCTNATNSKVASDSRSNGPDIVIRNLDWNGISGTAQANGKNFTADALKNFSEELRDTYMPKFLSGITSVFSSATPQVDAVSSVGGNNLSIGLTLYYSDTDGALGICGSNGSGFEMRLNMAYMDTNPDGSIKFSGDLAGTIVHEMTHALMFDYVTNGMLGSGGADSLPGWAVEGMAQAVGGGLDYCAEGISYYNSNNDSQLKNWLSDLSGDYSVYAQGYVASLYLGYVAGGEGAMDKATISSGISAVWDKVANGYSFSQAIYEATNGKYQDAADFERSFSTDALQFTKDLFALRAGGAIGALANSSLGQSYDELLNISGSDDYFVLDIDAGGFVDNSSAFHAAGVNALNGGGYTKTNGTDLNGQVNPNASSSWGSGSAGGGGGNAADGGGNVIYLQVGAEAGQFIGINRYKLSTKDIGLDAVNVKTDGGASKGIESYKQAMKKVSEIRSDYGATQNRIEHTIRNLDNVVENTTAAESRIRDTDMAKLMVEYSNDKIILQAGQSILAQANHSKDNVMSLLQ